MEAYSPDYALHNLPFIVLSGLDTTDAQEPLLSVQGVLPGRATTTVNSSLPPVTDERGQQLLHELLSADGSNAPWNARSANRRGNLVGFRIRTVGREFKFPPKKADAPSQSSITPPSSPTIAPSWILHSPISPLSPSSPIFPDGLLASSWIAKHQHYIPSVFVSFFDIGSDPTKNTIHDNQLKNEIAKIKAQIQKSEYRTRYAVVLIGDPSLSEASTVETEERLANIRRSSGLDPKTSLFFLPPNTSAKDLRAFAYSILSALQPVCIEYYRDLTKHARRKKTRGYIPQPTAPSTKYGGTLHPLSTTGWNIRYDFKLGVFAEFRQEMDAAQRHYSIALDALFGSEGIFEITASWSPRWDEIRQVADTIALRHIRCQLWNMYPTSAVRSWIAYKDKMRDLLDRRGKGSSNYGWEAWESRWAQIMAQLIQKAELPAFKISKPISDADPLVDGVQAIYSPPDKQIPIGERLHPWELLHHAGYWYKLSADHAKRRFILARDIPQEDRVPPGMSPASKVHQRNQTYDTYLVPFPHLENPLPGTEGGFEHWKDIVLKLSEAIVEFEARSQVRKVEHLKLEISRHLLFAKRYNDTFKILRPLWETMSWRRNGWWELASEVLWVLHECALRVKDSETYVLTEWELYSPVYTAKSKYRHDLMDCLRAFPQDDGSSKPSLSINRKDFESCVSVTFTFSEEEGNVGELLHAQVAVTSTARKGSAPITLSTLTFQFKGCLSEIQLHHEAGEPVAFSDVSLEEIITAPHKPRWSGSSDLTIHPGQTRVYSFPITFREAGDVHVLASVFEINTDRFDLLCTHSDLDHETDERPTWWLHAGSKLKPRKLKRGSGAIVKVLPKPPKMEIRLPDMRDQYYTDEPITLSIEVQNQEEEDTEAVLEVRLLGRSKDALAFSWVAREASSPMKEVPPEIDENSDLDLPGHVVGQLTKGERITEKISFYAPSELADYVLEVKVLYHLLSDRDIPISKTIFADLVFNCPFEATYELVARVHPDPWPSYFQSQPVSSEAAQAATGISQKWVLKSKIASFAEDELIVKDVTVSTDTIHGGATCDITPEFSPADTSIRPQQQAERSFNLDSQKTNLDERRPTDLDLHLNIAWQRSSSPSTTITTTLPIPHFSVHAGEPRVLAAASYSTTIPGVIHMDFVLENPTMHFLTFELTMEASEEFGFSGQKLRSLNLLPMSRQTVRYNLLPLVQGEWILPQLKVVDRYFNKTLKVVATDGLKVGKKGVKVWVPGNGKEKDGEDGKNRGSKEEQRDGFGRE